MPLCCGIQQQARFLFNTSIQRTLQNAFSRLPLPALRMLHCRGPCQYSLTMLTERGTV